MKRIFLLLVLLSTPGTCHADTAREFTVDEVPMNSNRATIEEKLARKGMIPIPYDTGPVAYGAFMDGDMNVQNQGPTIEYDAEGRSSRIEGRSLEVNGKLLFFFEDPAQAVAATLGSAPRSFVDRAREFRYDFYPSLCLEIRYRDSGYRGFIVEDLILDRAIASPFWLAAMEVGISSR